MIITELVNRIPVVEIHGDENREVSELVFDSRKVTENSLYIAMRGTVVDGHSFIASSIEKGATTIVCEEFPETLAENVTYIKVKDSAKTLGHLASNFYGNPSRKLKLIGVTGTNGKTSVSTLLFDVFKNLGYDSALLSTVEIRIGEEIIPATHTTPDVITINKILAEAVEKGCEFAFMEVSSHGIAQNRIEGLHFKVAGFTNLTHDHLDYHKTFEEYLKTKKDSSMNLKIPLLPSPMWMTKTETSCFRILRQKEVLCFENNGRLSREIIGSGFQRNAVEFQRKRILDDINWKIQCIQLAACIRNC